MTTIADTPMMVTIPSHEEIQQQQQQSQQQQHEEAMIKREEIEEEKKTYNNSLDEMDEEARARYEMYLKSKTDNFIRYDITSHTFAAMTEPQQVDEFIRNLPSNIKTIHLSGHALANHLTKSQLDTLVIDRLGTLPHLSELFVFQGQCDDLDEELLAKCLTNAKHVAVLMLWQFQRLWSSTSLPASIRMHPSLERLTVNLPKNMSDVTYGCLDMYAMAFAGMQRLRVLQIRCCDNDSGQNKQRESIISPEGLVVLMSSQSITSLYLENMGLTDEHIDAIADEFIHNHNHVLKSIDFKDNMFSDDVLYTVGRMLQHNHTLHNLDISGVNITQDGGVALMKGILHHNHTILHVELEGIYENYKNEFHIHIGHKRDPWHVQMLYQLRLNRAYHSAGVTFVEDIPQIQMRHVGDIGEGSMQPLLMTPITHMNATQLIEAMIHVSDHVGCIYYLLRQHTNLLYPTKITTKK